MTVTQHAVMPATAPRTTQTPDAVQLDGAAGSSPSSLPRPPLARTLTVADEYADLLRPLNNRQRRAMMLRLTFGFYDGWRPSRAEMADLVAVELGTLSSDEASRRQRQRALSANLDRGRWAHPPPG
jgi:hypothetical protein